VYVQVQMRDLPGFMETRQTLLHLKPGNRTNWISFAIAHHLNGSHDLAVQMLDTFENTVMGVLPRVALPCSRVPCADAVRSGQEQVCSARRLHWSSRQRAVVRYGRHLRQLWGTVIRALSWRIRRQRSRGKDWMRYTE